MVNTLLQINSTLDKLIALTKEDIENIKAAKHDEVFKNTKPKEELAEEFYNLKNQLDRILANRNMPIEEIFSKDEEVLFNQFREKLQTFYELHSKFSKFALSVANFYNALYEQINPTQKVTYKERTFSSSLELKV